jgi:hypothetical protein
MAKFILNQSGIDKIQNALDKTISEQSNLILKETLLVTPMKTGKLRTSGIVQKIKEYAYRVIFTAPYSLFVHEGSRHNRPTKFLEVTLNRLRNTIITNIKGIFK